MRRVVLTGFLCFCIAAILVPIHSNAISLECDSVQCWPDPGSSGYTNVARARTIPQNSRGTNGAFGAEAGPGGTENNLGSQSYNYAVPILRLPGRNGLDLSLTLYYNSRVWQIERTGVGTASLNSDRDFPSYGFRLDFGFLEYNDTDNVFILTEADGSKRRLVASGSIYVSDDSSFIDYDSSSKILRYKNGLQVHYAQFTTTGYVNFFNPTKIRDTNGNRITITYNSSDRINTITDTLGRVITYNYTDGRLTTITQALTPSGSKTWATFDWNTSLALTYNFTAGGFFVLAPGNTTGSSIQPETGSVIKVLTKCTYANGTSYRFNYGGWGIVNKIENLSASNPQEVRSSIEYNIPSGSTSHSDAPAFTEQTIFDGVNNVVYGYAVTKNSTGLVTSHTVTQPNWGSNRTKTVTNLSNAGDWKDGLVASVEIKKVSDSSVLRSVVNQWTADSSTNKNARVCRTISTLHDTGQQSKVELLYSGETTPCVAAATTNGNVIRQDEFDFGLVLKRRTETTYSTASALTGQHILDRPIEIKVKDAGGTVIARTDFDYDTTTLSGVSGTIAGHDTSNFGTSFTARGNLTKVKRFADASAGTGAIERFSTYDILGNLVSVDLDCCNKKTFAFSSATEFAYPDSITRGPSGGPQLTTSATYNINTGNISVATDENDKNTTFTFDSMNRLTNVDRPGDGDLTTSFDDNSQEIKVTTTTPITSGDSRVTVVTVDGEVTLQETKDDSNNVISTVKTIRDALGRVSQVSNPYGPGQTPVFTTTTYDALSRPITVAPPSQGSQSFEYSGNKVVSTDPAGKKRRHITDALGRLVRVDEPGSAGASTVTIDGSTQSVQASSGTPGTGSATISGTLASYMDDSDLGQCWYNQQGLFVCPTVYDTGYVRITIASTQKTAFYGEGSTATSIATALRNAFNADSGAPVTAGGSGTQITFTAKQPAGNHSLQIQKVSDDPAHFGSEGSFNASSVSGSTLTGGINPVSAATDSGTVTLTINGMSKVANYDGSSDKNSIATDLASQFNADANSPVTAHVAGATIWVVAKVEGSGSNYTLTTDETSSQPSTFPNGSYTISGSNLSGGGGSTGINNPIFTLYTYNVVDGLVSVKQGAQTRTYNYDSLGRLLDVTTPEAGTVQFTYTNFSAVASRTDARGVVTNYDYDDLHRLESISYNVGSTGVPATAGVTYTYGTSSTNNNKGRLLSMSDGVGSETYSYNSLGQITQVAKVINSTTHTTGYAYNLAGELQTITYPSGRQITQTYDAIGRLSQISSSGTNYLTVASSNGYNAAGQLLSVTFGNTVTGTYTYNDHLQLDSLKYMLSTTELLNLDYKYAAPNGGNNGQIQGIDDNTGGSNIAAKSITYTYDDWSRLSVAQTNNLTASDTWKLTWGYDRYGNRTSQDKVDGHSGFSVYEPSLGISPTTNRITDSGFAYDANGNLTDDSLHDYVYDAENRLVTLDATAATYTYDGGSLRVKKQVGSNTTVYIFSGSKVIAEYVNGSLSKEYIYSGSRLLATVAGSATTYHHGDHLSTRLETNSSGTVSRTFGHLPYGDIWYETGTADKWKFASYERDSESSLDYAIFRFNSWRLGRFMSPDPIAGDISSPQSLNRYIYALNDPINFGDPLGLDPVAVVPGETVIVTGIGTTIDLINSILSGNHGGMSGVGHGSTRSVAGAGSVEHSLNAPPVGEEPGGGGGTTEQTQAEQKRQDIWVYCLNKYGTAEARQHLSIAEYYAALNAAALAGADVADVLTIWHNETSFLDSNYWSPGPDQDIGPMQVTPVGAAEVRRKGFSTANYQTDLDANLLTGARYYLIQMGKVGGSGAAAAYTGGETRVKRNKMSKKQKFYQNKFNKYRPQYEKFVQCLRGEIT